MELTREDLIAVLKNRIQERVDLRSDNNFADYSDQYGTISWKQSYFNNISDDSLEAHIKLISKLPKLK